jgi:hypothetical protein
MVTGVQGQVQEEREGEKSVEEVSEFYYLGIAKEGSCDKDITRLNFWKAAKHLEEQRSNHQDKDKDSTV